MAYPKLIMVGRRHGHAALRAACQRRPSDRKPCKPSPEAIALARRTPWTVDYAETVLAAHAKHAPDADLDVFVNWVARVGLGPACVGWKVSS